ncbi:hypothetical protein BK665_01225 [Pseudomonas frederiksbergensis]|uniref:Uncharacterized protein n=1 Tax=Pseudomonas frederiksbergensis TaxID=104087 RepID=A0A423KSA5_9PSED|nr:hypothetical protein BK665_01225 [Pseudomonas frederiksbergensis]
MRANPEIAFFLSGLVLIVLILLVSLAMLYLAYFCAADILKHFSNSPAVVDKKSLLGWDPVGRFLFISRVGALLVFSRKYLKNGELDSNDYECFPVGLRRKIVIVNGLMLVLGTISIIGIITGRFSGWLT